MYKAGYDPNAFVTFFEKVEAEEKRQPGTMPKFFSTHPPTPDRVEAIQKEIGNVLPARDQYIVTTSEFDTVKLRLRRIENRNKLQDKQEHQRQAHPTHAHRTAAAQRAAARRRQPQKTADPSDDPDRPTLHKRTEDESTNP